MADYPTPTSLFQRLRCHPNAAWREFTSLYAPLMSNWAKCKFLVRDEDIPDLLQDVFLLLMRKLPDFDYDSSKSFTSWLKKVFKNEFLRRKRDLNKPDLVIDDPDTIPSGNNVQDWEEEQDIQLIVARAVDLVQAEFHPKTFQAWHMLVIEKVPVAEVAAKLEMTVGAVYTAKSHVLRRLREWLAGFIDWLPWLRDTPMPD